jgi:trehalose 6-phosphate phosphatase
LPDALATPAFPLTPAIEARLCGSPLVLLLDVDGTLAPIAPRPEYASVPNDTRQILTDLAAISDVRVVVISGRSADDARRLVGVPGVWIIGNHGIEVAAPGQEPTARDAVAGYAEPIAEAASRATRIADSLPGVIVENKRWTLSVHYRLAHPSVVPSLSARIAAIARELGLALTGGKEVLELRPPVEIDKGTAAILVAEELGALIDGASILCAGDDRTDEDMFRAFRSRHPDAVTVWVGPESAVDRTTAQFHVPDTAAMCELLEAVLKLRRARG